MRGLPGPICPECGTDLREAGAVATTGGRRPAGKWRLALGWSAFSALTVWVGFTFVWWTFILERLPYVREVRQDYTLGNPASGAYDRIRILSHAHGAVRVGRPDPAPASLALELSTTEGRHLELEVDAKSCAYQYAGANGDRRRGAPLNETALLAWLGGAGVRGDPTQLAEDARIVMATVRELQQTGQVGRQSIYPAFGSSTSSGSLTTSPLPFVQGIPTAVAFVAWLTGIVLIVLRKPARGETPSHG